MYVTWNVCNNVFIQWHGLNFTLIIFYTSFMINLNFVVPPLEMSPGRGRLHLSPFKRKKGVVHRPLVDGNHITLLWHPPQDESSWQLYSMCWQKQELDRSPTLRHLRRHLLLQAIIRKEDRRHPLKQRETEGRQRWAEPKPAATRLLLKTSQPAGTPLRLLRGTASPAAAAAFSRGSSPGGARWTASPSPRRTCGHRADTSRRRMCSDCGWRREVWVSY